MDGRRTVLRLALVVLAALAPGGCAWLKRSPPPTPLPARLPPTPTLEQVVEAVNANASQIHSFSTDEARLSVPGVPSLRTSIAFERPRRLRLRAGMQLTGTELDVGSNDELFWIWVARQPPLYYCRHDQFDASPARRVLPVDPNWLIEAFGISPIDPTAAQGPSVLPGGRLEVREVRNTAEGPTTKITVVQATTGVVLEQQVYDSQGLLVARAYAREHRRDPLTGLIMPQVVEVECPRAEFSATIALGNVRINRPIENPASLWAMPAIEGAPMVDLCDPNLRLVPGGSGPPPIQSSALPPPVVSSAISRPHSGRNRLLR
jgi:hypothetical protein